jgi:UDP-2,3-diacylglucosamine pyrophosphatase LpxH
MIKAESIWISDFHLGSLGTQVQALSHFLTEISCKNLFLNGDILDKWLLKNPKRVSEDVLAVIKQLNALQESGVTVIFCFGNHDQKSDVLAYFPAIQAQEETVYTGLNGKRYLVFHGHRLDLFNTLKSGIIAHFGTYFYESLLYFRKQKSSSRKSVSRFVKLAIKRTALFIFLFNWRLKCYAKKKGVDGVIYAHTHQAKQFIASGIEFYNSGDWIDNCSYVKEDVLGNFSVQRFNT